jgi:hypothetical protein
MRAVCYGFVLVLVVGACNAFDEPSSDRGAPRSPFGGFGGSPAPSFVPIAAQGGFMVPVSPVPGHDAGQAQDASAGSGPAVGDGVDLDAGHDVDDDAG